MAATWRPHKEYQKPIFDRLQSSYDDVRFEVNTMRQKFPAAKILFLAGDGLALMRLNHLLCSCPDEFLDSTPAVVPIQGAPCFYEVCERYVSVCVIACMYIFSGEHPHGLFHGMHCQARGGTSVS